MPQTQAERHRMDNAMMLYYFAEAMLLKCPLVVLIGGIPGEDEELFAEYQTNTYFEGLEREQQKALIEAAIVEIRNSI